MAPVQAIALPTGVSQVLFYGQAAPERVAVRLLGTLKHVKCSAAGLSCYLGGGGGLSLPRPTSKVGASAGTRFIAWLYVQYQRTCHAGAEGFTEKGAAHT